MASQIFQLVMRTGPTPGKTIDLQGAEIMIGRDTSNTIVINDVEVSRKHARLVAQAGGYLIEDAGSTNGTFVNGQRLMGPHLLSPGELLMFGENVSLVYEAVQYDPDATQISAAIAPPAASQGAYPPQEQAFEPLSPPAAQYPPEPAPQAPQQAAPPSQPAEPVYSGQVPPGPPEPYVQPRVPYTPPPEPESRSRTWLYVGCGCLVVVLCILVSAAFIFDYLNLYCTPPFNLLFSCP